MCCEVYALHVCYLQHIKIVDMLGCMIGPEFETALTGKSHSPLASDGIPPLFEDFFQFLEGT